MGTRITEEQLVEKLKKEMDATNCTSINDTSDGCGAKFEAVIVSPQFEGKALLARHRLVNTTLADEMKVIHAFSMKTYTPEQWEKQKGSSQ